MKLVLSATDRNALNTCARVLASPFAYATAHEWRVAAHSALGVLIGADYVASTMVLPDTPLLYSEGPDERELTGWTERTPRQPPPSGHSR